MKFTARQIAEYLAGEVVGNAEATVGEFAKIEEGKAGALSFLANPKYEHWLYETASSVVIVAADFVPQREVAATMVRVADPYAAFAGLLRLYDSARPKPKGVSERAAVAADAVLGEGCYVGEFAVISSGAVLGDGVMVYPQVYVGQGVTVGEGTVLNAGVKVYDGCVIGANVTVHAGTVVGADGFGFAPEGEQYAKIPQIGNVIIEDDVEIGANTCIDRATMGSTVIRRGAKLDNLIQVAHNVEIGAGTVIAAQAGLAGSSKLGAGCMIGGQVGLAGHLTLGDGVKMGAQSGIDKDVPAGEMLLGSPAMPVRKFHRAWAIFRNLPDLVARVNTLEKRILLFVVVCCCGVASAQQISVTVTNPDGRPVGWAFVGVNGRPIVATDSLGVALVDASRLAKGDSIGASMIGMNGEAVVYDGASEVALTLSDDAFRIDDVVVTDADPERLFRKTYKWFKQFIMPIVQNNMVVGGDVEYELDDARDVRGTFTAYNAKRFLEARLFGGSIQIETASDTTALLTPMLRDMHYVLHTSYRFMDALTTEKGRDLLHAKCYYMGRDDNQWRVFRFAFVTADDYNVQALYHIDDEKGQIRRMKLITLSVPDEMPEKFAKGRPYMPSYLDLEVTCRKFEPVYIYIDRLEGRIDWIKIADRTPYQSAEVKLTGMEVLKK